MATDIWEGGVDTDIDDPNNWSLGHIPQGGEDTLIPPTSNDPETTGNFTIFGNFDLQTGAKLTINAGDTVTVNDNGKTQTINGYMVLEGTIGNEAVFDFNSHATVTMNIYGYLKSTYGKLDNMNNVTPLNVEGGYIIMWDSEINCDKTWQLAGCAKRLQLINTPVTRYGTPTLTSGSYKFEFDTKYSSLEMSEGNIDATSNILQDTAKIIKMGEQAKILTIMGACLSSAWNEIPELRALTRLLANGTYRKLTFMCGDQTDYAVAGYMDMVGRKDEGPLYPKFYKLIIKESVY